MRGRDTFEEIYEYPALSSKWINEKGSKTSWIPLKYWQLVDRCDDTMSCSSKPCNDWMDYMESVVVAVWYTYKREWYVRGGCCFFQKSTDISKRTSLFPCHLASLRASMFFKRPAYVWFQTHGYAQLWEFWKLCTIFKRLWKKHTPIPYSGRVCRFRETTSAILF